MTERVRKTYTEIGGWLIKSNFKLGIAVLQQKSGVVIMTEEVQEAKISAMECDIKEIKQDIKDMPDLIVKKVNENTDMKIKLAIAETEKKYMGKFIALLIGLIGEGIGLIFSFIK